ncbi:hypothetical protein KUTeg_003494 [Tegillarca granosa]|uniref:Uncharacterized protein n=1 Tax=Tegillarca granosa TaxID=220873 RepID=A0ABQ9FRT8_TEGGR|nr:hypothetical protein KUTeg_003494 [Tegillarca granosa]
MDQQEQYSRRNAIRIAGIAENKDENTNEIVLDIAKRANLDITLSDIDRSHRVGPPNMGRNRQIIVKFTNYRAKYKLMKSRKHFKRSADPILKSVYINEDLTKARSNLYNAARTYVKNKHCHKCWTWDGKVFVTDTKDRKIRIDSLKDLIVLSQPPAPHHGKSSSQATHNGRSQTNDPTVLSYAAALSATSHMDVTSNSV